METGRLLAFLGEGGCKRPGGRAVGGLVPPRAPLLGALLGAP